VNEHRQTLAVDLRPHRLEQWIDQVAAPHIRKRRHSERAVGAGAGELG
jgi:hypothetical protein